MDHLWRWWHKESGWFLSSTMIRLVLAAILGGIIGLERELKRRPAGLRTNMFICFGAAMFTIISDKMASQFGGDHTRVAAQIIPGIGFIGAGSILHARGSVVGITTAATIFVVASIGMAVGAAMYLPAVFATVLILLALLVLGFLEMRFNLRPLTMTYEAVGKDSDSVLASVNQILEVQRCTMQSVTVGRTDGQYRVIFDVETTRGDHDELMKRFRQSTSISHIRTQATLDRE